MEGPPVRKVLLGGPPRIVASLGPSVVVVHVGWASVWLPPSSPVDGVDRNDEDSPFPEPVADRLACDSERDWDAARGSRTLFAREAAELMMEDVRVDAALGVSAWGALPLPLSVGGGFVESDMVIL